MFPFFQNRRIEHLQEEVRELTIKLSDLQAKAQANAQAALQAKAALDHQKMINAQQAQTITQLTATNQAAIDAGFDPSGPNVLQQIADTEDATAASLAAAVADTSSDTTSGTSSATPGADTSTATPATPAS